MSSIIDISPDATHAIAPAPTLAQPTLAAQPRRRDAFTRATRPAPAGRVTFRRLLIAVVVLILGIYVCRDAWTEIFLDYAWGNAESSHVIVVPFVIALLVYVRRLRLRHFKIVGTPLGTLITLTGLVMLFAGHRFDGQMMFHVGAVFVAIGSIVSVLGKGVIFRFGPAIVALLFLIPVPAAVRLDVATVVQNWTAQVAHVALGWMGFPNEIVGSTLSIRNRPVTIAEACNGMRSVVTLLLLAYAFAFALPLRAGVRVILLLASPIVAVACNVIRTLPTIVFYGYAPDWFANPKTGTWVADQFHWMAGYGMYAVAFAAWFGIVWLLRWTMLPIQRYTLASQART